MKNTAYADPFYGNFQPDLPEPEGIAANWFFLKAQVGNTHPGAALPFGFVSACAYTGGYSSGYGPYWINCNARPPKLPGMDEQHLQAMGFSHFHHAGAGYITEFYNYLICTPLHGAPKERFFRLPLTEEQASPGRYQCRFGRTLCRVGVTDGAAVYRFDFEGEGNVILFDPELNGLVRGEELLGYRGRILEKSCRDGALAVAVRYGSILWAKAVCPQCSAVRELEDGRFCMEIPGRRAVLTVGLSFAGAEDAAQSAEQALRIGPEGAWQEAEKRWEEALSIRIEADETAKTKFYSNFYHSLIKPVCATGRGPYWRDSPCYIDFATMWDMGKVQLPWLFTLYPKQGAEIAQSLLRSFDAFGFFPNALLLTPPGSDTDMQARALAVPALYDAFLRGVGGVDWDEALEKMQQEILSEKNRPFTETGRVSEYASQDLDLAAACSCIARLARARGRADTAARFAGWAENWKLVFDPATGLVRDEGQFYEGCCRNISFRIQADMEGRMALAGGREAFVRQLDDFFGYGQGPARQCLRPEDVKTLREGEARRGFEGFNNETDMEAPYAYLFAGRADRTAEIVRRGMDSLFGTGRGALCGNNDSGGLSSLYCSNALGLFPAAGLDFWMLGTPTVRRAEIPLASGKRSASNGRAQRKALCRSGFCSTAVCWKSRFSMCAF